MEEFLARLLDLQDLDRRIDRLRTELESIPREMEVHRKDMGAHEARFSVFREKMDSLKSLQKKFAAERSENVIRISDYRSRLLSLKTNVEYSAMLKQIAHTEEMIDLIDSRIIETMYEEDEALLQIEKAEKERNRAVRRSEAREESLMERKQELLNNLSSLELERVEVSLKVDSKQLKKYEKARSSGRREAVAGILNSSCGACLTKIPPQSAGEIKGGKTFSCPICGSFVVWTSDSSL
jgi:predicted  nucleic acid-binding Zn-ribbon protein